MSMVDWDFTKANPGNIWNYKQNHPELVIDDLKSTGQFTDEQLELVRQSMLARGINKWLKVRRDLISYKIAIKKTFPQLQKEINLLKQTISSNFVTYSQVESGEKSINEFNQFKEILTVYKLKKEKLKLLIRIRKDLKNLCMTERWQVWKGKKLEDMDDIKYKFF